MKKLLVISAVFISLVLSSQVWALSITPGSFSAADDYWGATDASGGIVTGWGSNSQSSIDAAIAWINLNEYDFVGDLLYKDESDGEVGPLAGSYETDIDWGSDPSGGNITYTGGATATNAWLLVKNGNVSPWWYLFDLTARDWDGEETLELSGFWPDQGSISHVTLYGGRFTPVPEPATLALLGIGLLGLARVQRKNK